MTELKQRVILVPIILQIMSSPTFIRQESLPYIKDVARFLLVEACGIPSAALPPQLPSGLLGSPSCGFWPCK